MAPAARRKSSGCPLIQRAPYSAIIGFDEGVAGAWIVGMLATVSLGVSLGLPAGAGAVSGLTLHACYGADAGCINIAGNPLQQADAIAVSRNGSVYVTGSAPPMGTGAASGFVSHFFAGKGGALSYDGCISDDGTGGACTDTRPPATSWGSPTASP